MDEWCEHIVHINSDEFVLYNRPSIDSREVAMWKYCPICCASRPIEESIELPTILNRDESRMSNHSMRKAINQIIEYLKHKELSERK